MSTRASMSFALRLLRFQRASCSSGFSARSFSSSAAHNAVRPIFNKTQNEELDAVLKTIQNMIILPAYLPEKQRKLIFDPAQRAYLEKNPVIIEVSGLEHRFAPINPFRDLENSKKLYNKAIDNMRSREDWENLATLLAGFRKAGIKLKPEHWDKTVRLAATQGYVNVILECAACAEETGLFFRKPEVVARVLAFSNDKISSKPTSNAEAKKALKSVELVLDLLQRPGHAYNPGEPTHKRMHFSRLVRGMVMYARAAYVQTCQEPTAKDKELLRDDALLLTTLWKDALDKDLSQVMEFAKLNPTMVRMTEGEVRKAKVPEGLNGSAYIQVVAQNIKAMKVAQEILGEEAASLSPIVEVLEKHLHKFAVKSERRTAVWDKAYEKVMGEKATWAEV
ncbi:hypothetical protein E4U52_000090 [Claviceps spartinae]|nr:hypothetical protein E4U52_000090 [Claviceps spartinae]